MTSISASSPGRATKLPQLCADIEALALALAPGQKLPTVRALQRQFGTTSVTLDAALTALEARGVVERRHGVGLYVSPHLHRRSIALVCEPFVFQMSGASPFWSVLVEQLEKRTTGHNESFSLHFLRPRDPQRADAPASPDGGLQSDLVELVRNDRVDGVLMIGPSQGAVEWLAARHVPIVAYAGYAPSYVVQDEDALIDMGVGALAEQGCRRVALWFPLSAFAGRMSEDDRRHERHTRSEVFRRALDRRGLPYLPNLLRDNADAYNAASGRVLSPQEQGFASAQAVFGLEDGLRPDGIVLTDDMLTQGALIGLQRVGLKPGRDVKIATHANKGLSVFVGHEDALIRIEYDPADVAEAMIGRLELLMEGKGRNGGAPPTSPVWVRPRIRV